MAKPVIIAVVTKADEELGLEIVKIFAKRLNPLLRGITFLTAKTEELAINAWKKLGPERANVKVQALDVESEESIRKFCAYIYERFGGISILINNMGQQSQVKKPSELLETLKMNLKISARVLEHFYPLLRAHARVVNVSSSVGIPCSIKYVDVEQSLLRNRLFSHDLNINELVPIVDEFSNLAELNERYVNNNEQFINRGRKTDITSIMQNIFDRDIRPGLMINSFNAGFKKSTKYSGQQPSISSDDLEVVLYLATLRIGAQNPRGKHFSADNKPDELKINKPKSVFYNFKLFD